MLWQTLLLETQILSRLVEGFIAPPPPVRKSTTAQFLTALAVVLACLGSVVLGLGIYEWLRETMTFRETAIAMGAGGLVLSAVLGSIAWTINNKRYIRAKITGKVVKHKVNNLYEAMTEEFSDKIREYPKTAAAAASLAGVVVGVKVKDMADGPLFSPENARKIEGAIKDFMH